MIEIFVENLSLHKGKWFELPIHFSEIENRLLLDNEHDYLITDYMAPFSISNYEDFSFMNELAEKLEEYAQYDAVNYLSELVLNGYFSDLLEAFERIEDIHVYSGCYSYGDYAEHFIEECGYLSGVPDIIRFHIDYEGIGRDISFDGNLYQADDSTIIEVAY